MSHIAKIELKIKDLDALKKVCGQLGYVFKENQKTYTWYGRFMNDTPLPDGVKIEDLGKCEHAIKSPHETYEVGLIKSQNGEGYDMIFDYWHNGIRTIANSIRQPYAIEATKNIVKKKRYRLLNEDKLENGSVQLTIRV